MLARCSKLAEAETIAASIVCNWLQEDGARPRFRDMVVDAIEQQRQITNQSYRAPSKEALRVPQPLASEDATCSMGEWSLSKSYLHLALIHDRVARTRRGRWQPIVRSEDRLYEFDVRLHLECIQLTPDECGDSESVARARSVLNDPLIEVHAIEDVRAALCAVGRDLEQIGSIIFELEPGDSFLHQFDFKIDLLASDGGSQVQSLTSDSRPDIQPHLEVEHDNRIRRAPYGEFQERADGTHTIAEAPIRRFTPNELATMADISSELIRQAVSELFPKKRRVRGVTYCVNEARSIMTEIMKRPTSTVREGAQRALNQLNAAQNTDNSPIESPNLKQ